MSKPITRRALGEIFRDLFVGGTAVAAANTLAPGCASHLSELDETLEQKAAKENLLGPVTVYAGLKEGSVYSREAFDLASQYFAEEVGINLNFEYVKPEDIVSGRIKYDHRTKLGLVEMKEGEFLKPPNPNKEDYLPLVEDRLLVSGGMANLKYGITALDSEIKLSGDKNRDIKAMTRLIVHELGHMFGLWHSFQYSDDDVEDMVGNLPNLMSYLAPKHGKYGFALTDGQKKTVREYVSGGHAFQLMKTCNFDFDEYCHRKWISYQIFK